MQKCDIFCATLCCFANAMMHLHLIAVAASLQSAEMALLSPLRSLLNKQRQLAGSNSLLGPDYYLILRAASCCSVRKKCSRRQSKSTPLSAMVHLLRYPANPPTKEGN
jgi:hypothetical protein